MSNKPKDLTVVISGNEGNIIVAEQITDETAAEIIGEIVDEQAAEILTEQPIEETPSDAVTIAAIEADKEIQLAEIQAETTIAIVDAENERETTWQEMMQTNMQEQAQTMAQMQATMDLIAAQLIPAPLTEAQAEMMAETDPNNSTPPSTLELTSETQTEATPESEDEKPEAPAPAPTRVKRRRI